MKLFLILLLFILACFSINAQDLIVAQSGDTINCKITKIKDGYIFYSISEGDMIKRSVISTSDIQYYVGGVKKKKVNTETKNVVQVYCPVKIEFGMNTGLSHRTTKIWEEISHINSDYTKKLKNGFYMCGQLVYFITNNHGLGIKYSVFKTSNNIDNAEYLDELDYSFRGKLSDDIKISFWGVYYSARYLKSNNIFYANLGLGKMIYKNNFDAILWNGYLSGTTIGAHFDIGYDYRILNNLSVGIKVSCYFGKIKNVKRVVYDASYIRINLPEEKLHNLNLSVGVKYLLR